MRAKLSAVGSSVLTAAITAAFACAVPCLAQDTPQNPPQAPVANVETASEDKPSSLQPSYSHVYCAGFVRDTKVSDDIRLVSGEEAYYKVVFARGNYVYINRGAQHGVRVGDRFMVVRPIEDPAKSEWFKGQAKIMSAMGTLYHDVGQLRVVSVEPKVAVAEVSFSCDYAQRGDIVRPYEERPIPPYKEPAPFDNFAPVSGKSVGMIISSIDFGQALGQWNTVYVNLGAAQGVKIGDYVRIFRHEGKVQDNLPVTKGYYYEVYGFGSVPLRYSWHDLPREVLGEGIVLNATRNAATVLITHLRQQAFTGDEIEVE